MKKVICGLISLAVSFVLCFLAYYSFLPAVNLRSPGFWTYLILVIICLGVTITLFFFDLDENYYEYSTSASILVVSGIVLTIYLLLFGFFGIISGNIFHANAAKNVAKVTVADEAIEDAFPDLMVEENLEKFPLVDLDTAILLGDKKIAGLNHASWYDVDDEYNLITYQGKYYRLSVIDYGDFWKFNKAKYEGLPGYVLVEVSPKDGKVVQDATVVVLDDPIRYSPGAFWSHDLTRHLRSQFKTYMFDTSYLEIDENGTPYWVTGVLRPTAGVFGVKTVTSFILTNAQTGESQEYYINNAPEWIDHIYSLNYLMNIAEWHYSFIDGYWNNVFSKTNVWRTSYFFRSNHTAKEESKTEADEFANFFGYNSTLDKNGQVMFYTGLTAANNAESNLAWLEIDTSTGEMFQYDIVGAEESSAQAAVEALVQEKRYEATFPLPANIGGYPSYIMCLKGKAGLVQCYGICNIDNYSIAVVADTLNEAIQAYMAKLEPEKYVVVEPTPSVTDPVEPTEPKKPEDLDDGLIKDPNPTPMIDIATEEASGVIESIYSAEIDGTTNFYYVIEENLYRSAITNNELQLFFEPGDEIKFEYVAKDDVNVIVSIEKIDSSETIE